LRGNFANFEGVWGALFVRAYHNVTGGAPAIVARANAWIEASRGLRERVA
jgi:hypothetical protein